MIFDETNLAIYLQIADLICDEILNGKYEEESRLPSVREMAATVEVNSNTVMRSYDRLASQNMIYNKRGIGFFVSVGARQRILDEKLQNLLSNQFPSLFALLKQLKVTPERLREVYQKWLDDEVRPYMPGE